MLPWLPAARKVKDADLTRGVPEHRLKRGDIVKLGDHHVARRQ